MISAANATGEDKNTKIADLVSSLSAAEKELLVKFGSYIEYCKSRNPTDFDFMSDPVLIGDYTSFHRYWQLHHTGPEQLADLAERRQSIVGSFNDLKTKGILEELNGPTLREYILTSNRQVNTSNYAKITELGRDLLNSIK